MPVFVDRGLKFLHGFQMSATTTELEAFRVVAQRLDRARRRLERAGGELLDDVRRQRQVLANRCGESLNRSRNVVLVRRLLLQRHGALVVRSCNVASMRIWLPNFTY